MLVGTDYIVTYDAVQGNPGTRFAWCSNRQHDDLPNIQHVKGGMAHVVDHATRGKNAVHGILMDSAKGGGSRMMVISHRRTSRSCPTAVRRGVPPPPYCGIKTPSGEDFVFQADDEIRFDNDGLLFTGTAGVVRRHKHGVSELALFHGSRIGNKEIRVTVDDPERGIAPHGPACLRSREPASGARPAC